MKISWQSTLISVAVTIVVMIGGFFLFKPVEKPNLELTQIQREFYALYNSNDLVRSPREHLVNDLRQAYRSTANPKLAEKFKSPSTSYPLLDNEMMNFVFTAIPTGKVWVGEKTYNCRLIGSKLNINGQQVSQDDYKIIQFLDGYDPRSDTKDGVCSNLIKETAIGINESIPKFILGIEDGSIQTAIKSEIANPGYIANFFSDYSGIFNWLKVPIVFSLFFLILNYGGLVTKSLRNVLKKHKAKLLADPVKPFSTPARSFMDGETYNDR